MEKMLAVKTAVLGAIGDGDDQEASAFVGDLARLIAKHNGPVRRVTQAIAELVAAGQLVQDGQTITRPSSRRCAPPTNRTEEKELADLAKVLSHPIRLRIVVAMSAGDAMSPVALSKRFGDVDLGTLGYHVTALVKAGAVQLVDERAVRGAMAHIYVLRPDIWIDLASFIRELSAAHPLTQAPQQ